MVGGVTAQLEDMLEALYTARVLYPEAVGSIVWTGRGLIPETHAVGTWYRNKGRRSRPTTHSYFVQCFMRSRSAFKEWILNLAGVALLVGLTRRASGRNDGML